MGLNAKDAGSDFHLLEVKSFGIARGILYRSNSPLIGGDSRKLKEVLVIRAKINCIINLVDSNYVIHDLSKNVPWYKKLLNEGKVICSPMTLTIPGVASNEKHLKEALQFMINNNGPYLIHCFAGIDRTGFVIMVLEALTGASIKDIIETYLSAYSFDDSDTSHIKSLYTSIHFINQIKTIFHGKNIFRINMRTDIEHYLVNNVGLSREEITKLRNILKGKIQGGLVNDALHSSDSGIRSP
jgi:protein tyrosine/serine phosphatase